MLVLITSGATVTFRKLISAAMDPELWSTLAENDVSNLLIQYGNEQVGGAHASEQYFKQLAARSGANWTKPTPKGQNSSLETLPGEYRCTWNHQNRKTLEIRAFSFSHNIGSLIEEADLVVSHAGTGSIIDALSRGRPLIVVPNEDLMDNHQLEVAKALAEMRCCAMATCESLIAAVKPLLSPLAPTFESLSLTQSSPLQGVLYWETAQN